MTAPLGWEEAYEMVCRSMELLGGAEGVVEIEDSGESGEETGDEAVLEGWRSSCRGRCAGECCNQPSGSWKRRSGGW